MIRTGEQFLESLRDGRRVLCAGEMIDDLTTHPKTRGFAHALAEYYDMHHDPHHQDEMTFVDEHGERWAKHWFLPHSKEDLVERREYHDYIFRHWSRGGMFTRPPASMLPVFYTLYQDPEPWESESQGHGGRPLAQNIRDKWEYLKSNDLSASPMFLDVQGDRSDPDSVADTPMLRIVDKSDDGIVVRGWKAIGTGVAFANEIFMGILWKPGPIAEQIVFGLVPANHPGRDPRRAPLARRSRRRSVRPPTRDRGDELDGMAYFDDVLIPWDRVQHSATLTTPSSYPQRLFDWIHAETQIRHVLHAELIVGPRHPDHRGTRHEQAPDRGSRRSPIWSASARPAERSRSQPRRPASSHPAASTSRTTSSSTSGVRITSRTVHKMIEHPHRLLRTGSGLLSDQSATLTTPNSAERCAAR